MDAVEDAIDEAHTLQEELQHKTTENAQLRGELLKETEHVSRLETKLRTVEKQKQVDVSKLQSWIESMKAEFQGEIHKLEEERERLDRENRVLKESNPQSSGTVKQPVRRGLSDALSENLELSERVDQLEAENKDLRKERDGLREELGSKKDLFTRRREQAGSLEQEAGSDQRSALTRAKNIARMVVARVQEQRLHRRLDEEGERAQEFEMQARDLGDQSASLNRENKLLREELELVRSHAQQQRVMKYGAHQRANDRGVKMEELQSQIEGLRLKLEESAQDEMMTLADMKGNAALMRSLYADLKAPDDFDAFDGIESDSSDPELESEPRSFEVPRCEESGLVTVSSANDDVAMVSIGSDGSASDVRPCSSQVVDTAAYKRYFEMYQPQEKTSSALATTLYAPPGGYQSKRERHIAKMAGSIVQQKLLKALHLIELLQRANNRLTEDMEDLEDASAMAQRMERWLLIVVTFMSLLVVGLGLGLMSSCKG